MFTLISNLNLEFKKKNVLVWFFQENWTFFWTCNAESEKGIVIYSILLCNRIVIQIKRLLDFIILVYFPIT